MTSEMSPSFPGLNQPDQRSANTILLGQSLLRLFALKASNTFDIHLRQNSIVSSLAARMTVLGELVVRIVLMVAFKKMRRVYARRVIAVVKNPTAFWQSAVRQFPTDDMSVLQPLTSAPYANLAVSPQFMRAPDPTIIWPTLVDLRPKSVFQRNRSSHTDRVAT